MVIGCGIAARVPLRIMVAAGRQPVPYKEGTTDEEITFGKTGNSAFDSLDAVRLHLGGRG
jgi:hypothetical protein